MQPPCIRRSTLWWRRWPGSGVGVRELMQKGGRTKKIDSKRYIIEGAATVQDILEELSRPGRDPKEELEPSFAPGIKKMEDLK